MQIKIKNTKYSNHIVHYQADAEANNYFEVDAFYEHQNRRRYEFFKNIHAFQSDEHVLEVGSGGGQAIKVFQKKQVFYIPLDIPLINLKKIKELADFPLYPVAGDTFHIPLKENSVDVVLISEVLEHLESPENALNEINHVLRQHGEIIISVPYKEKISFQLCVHCNQLTPKNAHFHSFDESKISEMLTDSGFESSKVFTINNKIINRLGLEVLLRRVPFTVWRFFDTLFNQFGRKAAHMVVVARKL